MDQLYARDDFNDIVIWYGWYREKDWKERE